MHAVGLLEHEPGDPGGSHLRPQLDVWTAALDRLEASQVERRLVAGEPVDALWAAAADCAADLVVVGTRGAGAHGAMRLGSTSLRLAEGCGVPGRDRAGHARCSTTLSAPVSAARENTS